MDPLAGSSWSAPGTVAGFAQSAPNAELMAFAALALTRCAGGRALDIGCGAGRNALPLARLGWRVVGTDLSWPMLCAAAERARQPEAERRLDVLLAPMECLPVRAASVDLVVAHGIWNLARSGRQFRQGLEEAARVAKPGAALFVFTFSRHTLPEAAAPVAGETFVFTQFSGEPQCFVTDAQLDAELSRAGFAREPHESLREHNRPKPGLALANRAPVIYEGVYRRRG